MLYLPFRRRPRGEVCVYRDGILIRRTRNLVVNAAATAVANLAAGVTAGQSVAIVGFGSGTAVPAVTDTDLATPPKYYNAVEGYTFPEAGSVLFTGELSTGDYAAAGITVQEVGLFGNSGSVLVPSYVGSGISAWAASHAYTVGALVVDSNGNIQRCTTAGESGSSAPAWATVIDNTTTDNSVTWKLVAGHAVPQPMWAHAQMTAFEFTGSAPYTFTWQLDF